MTNTPISQQDGYDSDEWFTPPQWIERARTVLRIIELDPASCAAAQEIVKAMRFFTKADNGLTQEWKGCVWMNPPYSQPLIAQFTDKLCEEWDYGRVTGAIVLTNSATETRWYQALLKRASAICLPSARIHFLRANAKPTNPRLGSTLFYLGNMPDRFAHFFHDAGAILYHKRW